MNGWSKYIEMTDITSDKSKKFIGIIPLIGSAK